MVNGKWHHPHSLGGQPARSLFLAHSLFCCLSLAFSLFLLALLVREGAWRDSVGGVRPVHRRFPPANGASGRNPQTAWGPSETLCFRLILSSTSNGRRRTVHCPVSSAHTRCQRRWWRRRQVPGCGMDPRWVMQACRSSGKGAAGRAGGAAVHVQQSASTACSSVSPFSLPSTPPPSLPDPASRTQDRDRTGTG